MDIIGIGLWEVLVIMVVLLIVVGPRRLPELSRKLGELARQFKTVTNELSRDIERQIRDETDEAGKETKSNDYSIIDDPDSSNNNRKREND